MARFSRGFVFVFLHQTRPDSSPSYGLVAREYLPEEFLHPVYFFLRPDGTEADEGNRHEHEALSAARVEKILDGIRREWGPGLSEEDYEAARASLGSAEKLFLGGDEDGARRILRKLSRLRARCGIKDRAAAMLRDLETRKTLLASWRGKEGIPGALAGAVEKAILAGDLVGAFRRLRKARPASGPVSEFLEEVVRALRETIRLAPLRLERVFVGSRTYYYLRAEWATDLLPFDGLALQIGYLVEGPRTYEGYAIYDEVRPGRHHRAAVSVTARDLRLRDPVNGRAQLWIDDLLLHESLVAKEPAEFPEDPSHVKTGPDLLRPEESLGVSAHERLRDYRVGRYPGAR